MRIPPSKGYISSIDNSEATKNCKINGNNKYKQKFTLKAKR